MKRLFLFLLPAFLFQQTIIPQWVQTNGPNDAPVYSFAVSGANPFAGPSGGGVFLSTNNGVSWTSIGLTDQWVINSLAVIGTKVFAGTGWNQGVFLSTDNGTTWTSANTPFGGFSHMVQLGTHLFAGTGEGCCLGGGGAVFLTTNNGTNWNEVGPLGSGLMVHMVTCLVVSNADLYAGTDTRGVFRSTNNGTNWSPVNEGLPQYLRDTTWYIPIECLVTSGENLLAGIGGGGVFLSTNSGSSWSEVNEGLN